MSSVRGLQIASGGLGWQGVVTTIAAGVAAIAGTIGVVLARKTVAEAEQNRLEAEHDRKRHRLERVGELLEDLQRDCIARFPGFTGHEWEWTRNKLRAALVGLREELPRSAVAADAGTLALAAAAVPDARLELDGVLTASEVSTRPEPHHGRFRR